MRHYRKIATLIAVYLVLCVLFVTGCEQEKVYVPVTVNTLEVTEDGSLIGYIVEAFDKDYYDIQELDSMVRSEMDIYNEKKANLAAGVGRVPIQVEKVMMAEDGSANAVVALNFANAAVYRDYMGKDIFYGTVSQAVSSGYTLTGMLNSVKDGAVFGTEQIVKDGEKSVLIVEDTVSIRVNDKVQYLSPNAKLTEEGFVDGTSEEPKYIITK